MSTRPITERSNELTLGLDAATGEGIARLLRASDAQIFAGFEGHPAISDEEVRANMLRAARVLASGVLSHDRGAVVISGSGTSGRLAFMVATQLNRELAGVRGFRGNDLAENNGGPFYYCNSGGDSALLLPSELAEDNTTRGVSDLCSVIQRARAEGAPVMVIGVTCGMSAPYVAGQLDFVLDQMESSASEGRQPMCDFTPVLIGFNPVELARDIPIEMWKDRRDGRTHTFRDVAQRMQASEKAIIINPVIGPESLCGSTRMKGGTATKVVLETVFATALSSLPSVTAAASSGTSETLSMSTVDKILFKYAEVISSAYAPTADLGRMIDVCGASLRSTDGHVYYLGGDDVASIVGFIDASEMRPTFGAPADETRGFAECGWKSLGNVEGDLSGEGPLYKVDFAAFRDVVLPTLTQNDTIVALHCDSGGGLTDKLVLEAQASTGCKAVRLAVSRDSRNQDLDDHARSSWTEMCHVHLPLSALNSIFFPSSRRAVKSKGVYSYDGYGALCLKVVLNALSTGAQVMAGRALANRMINVTPSNHKLFLRCTGLVKLLANMSFLGTVQGKLRAAQSGKAVGDDDARRCLIRAIYETDDSAIVDDLNKNTPVSEYIKEANRRGSVKRANKLLPIAILLAVGADGLRTVEEAKAALDMFGTVREALQATV